MIYSLDGILTETTRDMAVISCGGVGYGFRASLHTLSKLPKLNEKAFVYIHTAVREDAIELFGFAEQEERTIFRILIGVSGVGPKAAISILSDLTPSQVALCIATGDAKTLTQCVGIGKKTAERIVLECRDKISKSELQPADNAISEQEIRTVAGDNLSEAISALVVLGYPQQIAAKALAKADKSLPVEELIKIGLRQLAANL